MARNYAHEMLFVKRLLSNDSSVEHKTDVLLFDARLINSRNDRITSAQNCRLFTNQLWEIWKLLIMIINRLICPRTLILRSNKLKTGHTLWKLRFSYISRTFSLLYNVFLVALERTIVSFVFLFIEFRLKLFGVFLGDHLGCSLNDAWDVLLEKIFSIVAYQGVSS